MTDLLHDYVDGALSPAQADDVTRHLEACVQCRADFNALRVLTRSLAALPAPVARPGVLERVLKNAVRVPLEPERWWRRPTWNRAGLAAAAVLLLAIGFGLGQRTADRNLAGAQIVLTANPVELGPRVQTIGLMFRASERVQDASISVWLPNDVQIAGRPTVRQLSWHTDLKRGPNLLELPLLATGPHSGTLLVRLSQGSLVKTLEVPIAIPPPKEPAAASATRGARAARA